MSAELAKQFEEQLIQLINTCNLPIETAYYIVKNQTLELELLYNNVVYSSKLQETTGDKVETTEITDVPININNQQINDNLDN